MLLSLSNPNSNRYNLPLLCFWIENTDHDILLLDLTLCIIARLHLIAGDAGDLSGFFSKMTDDMQKTHQLELQINSVYLVNVI